ncbi:3-phenylpropionate MFS transporter [Escherichia coli]|nr:3-phenylpropionate MFS transporter [Escherichia coli]
MVLQSTRWLALGYFTYFFSYGIFLPFWSVWLKGIGLTPETIGLLLGAGLVARFLGSLLIAPRVSDPSRLISALRVLALLTLLFAVAFWAGAHVAWLMLVMIGFNLFFSPLVPLTDALANTWQKQFPLDYGKVRLWGSVAFVIGSALTGKLVSMFDYRVILALLTLGVASMLLGFLIRPTIQPQGASRQQERAPAGLRGWRWFARTGAFWPAFVYCRGHMRPITVLAPFTGRQAGYSASAVGYLWSLGVVAEVIIFALSNKLFRRCSARDMLLISAICGVVRWGIMGATTALPWLIVVQILHCGTFTVCHLAAMRYIAARQGSEVIRLQAVYSAVAMGGSIAIMTVFAGFLYQYLGHGVFWVMALVALPAMFLRPKVVPSC